MFIINSITVTLFVAASSFALYWAGKLLVNFLANEDKTITFFYFVMGLILSIGVAVVSTFWVMDYVHLYPGYGIALFALYLLVWVKPYQKNMLGRFTSLTNVGIPISLLFLLVSVHFTNSVG